VRNAFPGKGDKKISSACIYTEDAKRSVLKKRNRGRSGRSTFREIKNFRKTREGRDKGNLLLLG